MNMNELIDDELIEVYDQMDRYANRVRSFLVIGGSVSICLILYTVWRWW